MLKIFRSLSFGLGVALLMVSCSDMEDVNPSSTLSGVSSDAVVAATEIGPYTVSDLSVANDGTTWSFTVQRTGTPQGNGLSHLILNLRDCDGNIIPLSEAEVAGASVNGVGGSFVSPESLIIAYSEGSGTRCNMTDAYGFVKYDDLDDALSDGTPYTFTLKLNTSVYVETVDVWVKAGNACYKGMVYGSGCPEEIGCSYSQGQVKNHLNVDGVTITVGDYNYSGSEAVAIMNSTVNTAGVKTAFSQVASIKISKALGKLKNIALIAEDLAIVEDALASINKLTTTDRPSGDISSDAKAAAERIGKWIDANNCELEKETRVMPVSKGKK